MDKHALKLSFSQSVRGIARSDGTLLQYTIVQNMAVITVLTELLTL